MIIVWAWAWASQGLGLGNWQIAGINHKNDLVVCLDLRATPAGMLELQAYLEQYTRHEGTVVLLLHRHHGYHQDHVKALLALQLPADHGNFQCFLFDEGTDAVYLTANPRGLLGTAGTFSARVNFAGQQLDISAVADADRKELKPAHFNYVWQLYQLALRRRIFELREDLLSYLGQFLPRTGFAPGELYTLLSQPQDRLLLLRLLSFVGRIRKHSDLAREIRTFERNNNRTLTFEDCGIQLEAAYGPLAAEQHAGLVAFLQKHLLATGEAVHVVELRERFDGLLLQIPGPTYFS